jgi:hypothetical protein
VNLAEARDLLARRGVEGSTDEIVRRGLVVVPCDLDLADRAADVRATHYHRIDRPVSLADCIGVVTAHRTGGTLVTSDADQAAVARSVGVDVLAIANSEGVIPEA